MEVWDFKHQARVKHLEAKPSWYPELHKLFGKTRNQRIMMNHLKIKTIFLRVRKLCLLMVEVVAVKILIQQNTKSLNKWKQVEVEDDFGVFYGSTVSTVSNVGEFLLPEYEFF